MQQKQKKAVMKQTSVFILFPHQLFEDIEPLKQADCILLIEEYLFLKQYAFHQSKLVFHRASMKAYTQRLTQAGLLCRYIESHEEESDIRKMLPILAAEKYQTIYCYDVCDDWLEKRLKKGCEAFGIALREQTTPLFLNSKEDLKTYFEGKKKYFQTDFYIQQRKKWNILVDDSKKPVGGQWSYDADNRLKYPKDKKAPIISFPKMDPHYEEAVLYVQQHFPDNPGKIISAFIYPTTHEAAAKWLQAFLEQRFFDFGLYEDAIVSDENILHHSVLSPLMNVGLLLPKQVVDAALSYADQHQVPINSLEGFIRQIIGWREFIRGVYLYKGAEARTRNYWQFKEPLPASFYTGNTGIKPIDDSIRKVMETGYSHHIERLMLLGNMMLLLETRPDDVYRWFMEMYIDAYDWVMVPNVYGMSQFADGGLFATKPYISGSAYVLKMSDYKKDKWCDVWDAMFWEFMNKYRSFFLSNPRLGMLIRTYDKMEASKKEHLSTLKEMFKLQLKLH